MQREVIRTEPLSTDLGRWRAPTSAITRHGDTIDLSGRSPSDRVGDLGAFERIEA